MLDTLSPFPHRRVSSRASASAASSADDVLPSSSLAAPRDPSPLIASPTWAQVAAMNDNEPTNGPMILAVITLAIIAGSFLGAGFYALVLALRAL